MTGNGNGNNNVAEVVAALLNGTEPPRQLVVAVSGAQGKMARKHNIPFFQTKGCQILRADVAYVQAGMDNISQAKRADIFNVSVRPIPNTWPVVREVAAHLKPGSLVLNSPSIQIPVNEDPSDVIGQLHERGIDVGFVHFMFGPTVTSWRGMSDMFGFAEPMINPDWKDLIVRWILEELMAVWRATFTSHDDATTITQVNPMIQAAASSAAWEHFAELPFEEYLNAMGPPGWLPAYGQLASLRQPDLTAEIITYHPRSVELLEFYIEYLTVMLERVRAQDQAGVRELHRKPNIAVDRLANVYSHVEQHVQSEADWRGGAHGFYLTKAQNAIVGAVTALMRVYDRLKVKKTSMGAQTKVRKGSAVFYVGAEFDPKDPDAEDNLQRAEEARQYIIDNNMARALPVQRELGEVDETFYRPE